MNKAVKPRCENELALKVPDKFRDYFLCNNIFANNKLQILNK
jgi:hypothetical protein